jgi:hypothetical protein
MRAFGEVLRLQPGSALARQIQEYLQNKKR